MPGVGSRTGELASLWRVESPGYVEALAYSPDGSYLAASSVEGPVTLCDARTGDGQRELAGHGFGTAAISWSPDGRTLATAGQDGAAKLWDAREGAELARLAGGSSWVSGVAHSPDGRYLATAAGRCLRLWKAVREGCELLWESEDHESTVTDVRWRPGSSKEFAVASYGGLTLYRPASPEPARRFAWKGSTLTIGWSPNGKYIATGDQDSTVHFWIHATGRDLQMFGYPTKVRELSWNSTSRYLATGGGPLVTVWDCSGKGPEGTTPISLEAHEDFLADLAFQRKGSLLASCAGDGLVALWEPGANKRPVSAAALEAPATRLAWSPDDRRLAAGDEDGGVAVYETPERR